MQLPYYIDLLGTLVFAVSGALAASDKNMYKDIFGVTFTSFVTAVNINSFISVFVIIIIRIISVKYKLTLPKVGSR